MKHLTLGLLIGAILGSTLGFAIGMAAFPSVFPMTAKGLLADARIPEPRSRYAPVARGSFLDADPADPDYYGSGGLTLHTDLVALEPDFEVAPGPKYHLYLVREAEITPLTRVEETMFVDLGPLRAFRGAQSYRIPAGTELADYGSVVVWCEHFNLLVSPARLHPPQEAKERLRGRSSGDRGSP